MKMKRGTRIEYTYAAGKVAAGRILRVYTPKEIAAHAKSHGEAAAARLPEWFPCELTDEHGTYKGACHVSQLRVISNR